MIKSADLLNTVDVTIESLKSLKCKRQSRQSANACHERTHEHMICSLLFHIKRTSVQQRLYLLKLKQL